MNEPDRHIEQTLSALRHVQTPLGLEQRVLQSLDHELSKEPKARGRDWRRAVASHRLALGAVCALLLIMLAVALLHPVPQHPTLTAHRSGSQSLPQPAVQVAGSMQPIHETPASTPPRPAQHRVHLTRLDRPIQASRLPDFHAPPPLTEQERLLQQLARSHDPSQFAMLNPDVLARQEAEHDAQFHDFFSAKPIQNP